MFSVNSFPGLTFLPAKIKSAMVDCANSALSADTWKRYGAMRTRRGGEPVKGRVVNEHWS